MPFVFNRFARTRVASAGSVKGFGLGLYIARGLVVAHHGRIWAESVAGDTTFHITLPLDGPPVPGRGDPSADRAPGAGVGMTTSLVFPPALARVARERLAPHERLPVGRVGSGARAAAHHRVLRGLETYEGEHYPIAVTFVGRSSSDFVMTDADATAGVPLYRWKVLRFAAPRPFVPRELVKLAVASTDRRMYSAVGILR